MLIMSEKCKCGGILDVMVLVIDNIKYADCAVCRICLNSTILPTEKISDLLKQHIIKREENNDGL